MRYAGASSVEGGGPVPYTVKQVSALTGIAPDRLRAWERRYGVVRPTRTEGGYRLYDDDDLARLRLMMRLVDAVSLRVAAWVSVPTLPVIRTVPRTRCLSASRWASI